MTLNSLRTFLRVKLYTAISLMVDIADTTESRSSSQFRINRSSSSNLSAISSVEIPVQRLSGTNPVRYQSAVVLQLASKMKVRPQELAIAICDAYDTLEPALGFPGTLSIAANATGWLTVALPDTDLMVFLDQTLSNQSGVLPLSPHDFPFLIWQTDQRCRSLRSHLERNLQQVYPLECNLAQDSPEPHCHAEVQSILNRSTLSALMESLLDWMDDKGPSKIPHKTLIQVCQCFDRLHQQVPLFHPQTARQTQHQFLRSLMWVQGAIRYEARLYKCDK